MPDARESPDQPPADGVLGNLPPTRPGRRSARRPPVATEPAETDDQNPPRVEATPTTAASQAGRAKNAARASESPANGHAPRNGGRPASAPPRAGRSVKRAPAPAPEAPSPPPVPPAPRAGWATPEEAERQPSAGGVSGLVGDAVQQGERLVRGVLGRLTGR